MTSEKDKLKVEKVPDYTSGFKKELIEAAEEAAKQMADFKAFWDQWIPGGLRKRKRFTTMGHGRRKGINRRRNKVARKARRQNRRKK